jgi:hypothetical protein
MLTFMQTKRDPRVDVLRGAALLMIFIDHLPGNTLSLFTLHNFGFCDAAEVFVLLAGLSSMMAYGKIFARNGWRAGLQKIGWRCLRIYAYQAGLLVTTMIVVQYWMTYFGLAPIAIAPLLDSGLTGLLRGLTLRALPNYLDILPLYIVLLALFPLIYTCLQRNLRLAVAGSALVWLAASLDHRLTLPNWLDVNGWYFNPFAWQFLFTLGAALAVGMTRNDGSLPSRRWLTALCWAYLGLAFLESAPWTQWHLPDLRIFDMAAPDKRHLAPSRLLDVLALCYVIFSSEAARRLAQSRLARPLEASGKHSLEIFALGCVLALIGRLVFRTYGREAVLTVAVNAIGLLVTIAVGLWMERRRPPEYRHALAFPRG